MYRPLSIVKPVRKKKTSKARVKSTTVSFPVDFFEHCQPLLNEVEFGGGDILQVYNVQQAKHRLMTAGMYIASTKVQCMYVCMYMYSVFCLLRRAAFVFAFLINNGRFWCYYVMYYCWSKVLFRGKAEERLFI